MKNKQFIFIVAIILILPIFIYFVFIDKEEIENEKTAIEEEVVEKKLQIFDENSKARTIAVSIGNTEAALPHKGLDKAYIVYEIITEGGISRLIALFKDVNNVIVGPVRSARHYFLDYVLENDTIFAHCGGSPQAKNAISKLRINTLEEDYALKSFFRDKNLKAPHNLFANIDSLREASNKRKYRLESEEKLLKYSIDEINISENVANEIEIVYSSYSKTKYVYDEVNKVYLRFFNNKKHVDGVTNKQYTVKNIIVYQVANIPDPTNSDGGRQDLLNIGEGDGYYFTNGHYVPIKWYKSSHSAKTVYKDLDGNEIVMNDGNTFIQIQPKNQKLNIQ